MTFMLNTFITNSCGINKYFFGIAVRNDTVGLVCKRKEII
jgi:hypothetical protein